jgi:hypothetical protein
MSNSRDRQNVLGLLKLLGRVPPPPEAKQRLMIVAPAAGGGGGSPDVILAATGLTAGLVYRLAGTWGVVDTASDADGLTGVALSATSIQVAGVIARSGTAGATVYADASGGLTETDPGDPTDHGGAWVNVVGYQVDADRMLLTPRIPFRPHETKFCGADGTTAYTIITHEFAA